MTKIYVAVIEDGADFGRCLERWFHADREWLEETMDKRCIELHNKWTDEHMGEDPNLFRPTFDIVEVEMIQPYWLTRPEKEQLAARSVCSDIAEDNTEDAEGTHLDPLGRRDYLDMMGINEDGSLIHPKTEG